MQKKPRMASNKRPHSRIRKLLWLIMPATLLCTSIIASPSLYAKESPETEQSFSDTHVTAIYRLYNRSTGEHFYTSHMEEKEALVKGGWKDEDIAWYSYTQGDPVYRLYNPFAKGGDHYYTTSKAEGDTLVYLGWKYDFGAQPVFFSGGNTDVYVEYNPHAASGTHNYTTSLREHQSLLDLGWTNQGVAWKTAAPAPTADGSESDFYVLNTYSKVFHEPDCLAIPKIPAYRHAISGKTADQLEQEGYIPCPLCDPTGDSFLEELH